MTIDHAAFAATLQTKLSNSGSADAKELLLLSKTLESFSSVYTMKELTEAFSSLSSFCIDEIGKYPIKSSDTTPSIEVADPKIGAFHFDSSAGELWVCVVDTPNSAGWLTLDKRKSINVPQGGITFTTVGTHTFTVPEGVKSISAVAIGSGGGGNCNWASQVGGGGALAWASDIPVTSGQTIEITVPGKTAQGQRGGNAIVGNLFTAEGGHSSSDIAATPKAGTISPKGGNGGLRFHISGGGGGGAGGYLGAGGNGARGSNHGTGGVGSSNPSEGSGAAAGGGGYESSTYAFGGGGGVGLYGIGPTPSTAYQNHGNTWLYDGKYGGKGGSDGENGMDNTNRQETKDGRERYHAEGGKFGGGGGGGGTSVTSNALFCNGGQGGVRICWGFGMTYPDLAPKLDNEVIV